MVNSIRGKEDVAAYTVRRLQYEMEGIVRRMTRRAWLRACEAAYDESANRGRGNALAHNEKCKSCMAGVPPCSNHRGLAAMIRIEYATSFFISKHSLRHEKTTLPESLASGSLR
jgi:hypothetical protein